MKSKYILYFLIFLLLLTGCDSGLKKNLGIEKDAPDAFLVKKRNPIILPPDYDIPPPNSKTKKIKKNSDNDLKNILTGSSETEVSQTTSNSKPSSIEDEVLKNIK